MTLFIIFGWFLLISAGLSVFIHIAKANEDSMTEAKYRPFLAVIALLQFIWIYYALFVK